jgi:hypothetical protein
MQNLHQSTWCRENVHDTRLWLVEQLLLRPFFVKKHKYESRGRLKIYTNFVLWRQLTNSCSSQMNFSTANDNGHTYKFYLKHYFVYFGAKCWSYRLLGKRWTTVCKSKVKLSRYRHAGVKGETKYSAYSFLNSTLAGMSGQRLSPAAIYPADRTPGIHCIEGWVGLRAGLGSEASEKILFLCRGSNTADPVCSETLCWLSYPSSRTTLCRITDFV